MINEKNKVSRREFIKISGATVAAAAAASAGAGYLFSEIKTNSDGKTDRKIVNTYCDVCFFQCGLNVTVENGVAVNIEGNPHHPLSRGKLCPRGTGGLGQLYDKDRIKNPLKRTTNLLGQQTFKEISWDQALDEIAEKMKEIIGKYGPQSMGMVKHGKGAEPWEQLWHAIGSKTEGHASFAQCRGPRDVGWIITYGSNPGSPEMVALDKAEVVAFIGGHLGENMHNINVQDFALGLKNGARNIVVDPRHSTTAAKAKYWLPIKPGTDTALLLAWMNVLISEGLYDKAFVANHTLGFDKLSAHVKNMTPEWAAAYTGLDAEAIRATARELGNARGKSLVWPGRKYVWYGDDTQRARAVAILNALLGAWHNENALFPGDRFPLPEPTLGHHSHKKGKKAFDQMAKYPFATDVPAQDIMASAIPGKYEAGKDATVKGMVIYSSNVVTSIPNGRELSEQMAENLDLLVVVETMPAEITGFADYVLPDTTYLERYDVLTAPPWREPFLAIRQPVVKPLHNSKPSWWIALQLAKRLGYKEEFGYEDYKEVIENQLAQIGSSIDDINKNHGVLKKEYKKPPMKLKTPSGKVELYSELLASAGFDPMPVFKPPVPGPEGFLRLLFGRAPQHTFTRTTNNTLLREVYSENDVWVNHKVAKRFGLENGQYVVLMNQDGVKSDKVKVRVTERIHEDCVYMVHGFGRRDRRLTKAYKKGASVGELVTKYEIDPIMGGTGSQVNFVTFTL